MFKTFSLETEKNEELLGYHFHASGLNLTLR